MAVYDLEEQEQIENVKAWWRRHGDRVLIVLLIIAVAVSGSLFWKNYQHQQALGASVVFEDLYQAVQGKNQEAVTTLAAELRDKFGGTAQATLGTLLSAKSALEAGDAKTAQVQLEWAVANGKDELLDLARLHLAAVLLAEKNFEQALKTLDVTPAAAFVPLYSDLRGDVLAAQGQVAEARQAYQNAMDLLKDKEGNDDALTAEVRQLHQGATELIRIKLDALGDAS